MQPHPGTKHCSIESLSPARGGSAPQRELPLKAPVFNVQKFSLDDGPGIRTVVFLKGCPLRCAWCANPESQLAYSQLEWDGRSCRGCGCCAAASRAVTLAFDEDGLPQVSVDHAALAAEKRQPQVAGACVWGAMSLVGAEKSVDEVVAQCLQDQPFYEQSGGGVTFSGGEALLWPDFVRQAADRLHAQGISCALETTGHAAPEVFEQVLDAMDILLFDVKHWDDAAHKAGTSVNLARIKDNLRRAFASGAQVLCRTPVIPGFNIDPSLSASAVAATADGLAAHILDAWQAAGCPGAHGGKAAEKPRLQLLPFHQFGENKYKLLGREYGMEGVAQLSAQDVEPLAEALRERGVDAFV